MTMIEDIQDITSCKWATVTDTSPLAIQLDGSSSPLAVEPDTLVDPLLLSVGSRVRVELSLRKVVILGLSGGGLFDQFYSKAQLNAGQLDTRYYTETEINEMFKAPQQGVIPSSVAVGSGSASVADDGTVTFTNVGTRLALNGIFDGLGMDMYVIYLYCTQAAAGTIATRLRSGTTDYSTADHIYVSNTNFLGSGPSRAASTSSNAFGWWRASSAGSNAIVMGDILIANPAKTTSAWGHMRSFGAWNGDRTQWLESFNHASGSAFTALSLVVSASTISGQIKVVKIG